MRTAIIKTFAQLAIGYFTAINTDLLAMNAHHFTEKNLFGKKIRRRNERVN